MPKEAKVYILDVPYHADTVYSYAVPPTMEQEIYPGVLVEVPFGKGNRRMTAMVAETDETADTENMKPVAAAVSGGELISGEMLRLCLFMKDYTLCTFGEALRAVVPSAAMAKVVTTYRITDESERQGEKSIDTVLGLLGETGRAAYEAALKKGRFTAQILQNETGADCTRALEQMLKYRLCEKCVELKGASAVRQKRFLSLTETAAGNGTPEETAGMLRGDNQKKLFLAAAAAEGRETEENELFASAGLMRPAGRAAEDALLRKGWLSLRLEDDYAKSSFFSDPLLAEAKGQHTQAPVLTEEQTRAADQIISRYESGEPSGILLHGITGSGKTSVILSVIDRVLRDGRGVIMLVPEIALTPQTVGIFVRRYGNRIAVIHSGLSAGERYDAWRKIRDGAADVVIGTRSAVFAPMKNIGLIVIDEEQEYTYKSDTNPKYHAHDIASFRCGEHKAVLLLSSATPSVGSYYKARTGSYGLVELKERYGNAVLPQVEIYDMRGEVSAGNLSPVGGLLAGHLLKDKKEGNQSILFLNRRGYHNYISCRSCGKSIKCPDCSVTMTYHAGRGHMNPVNRDDPAATEADRRQNGYLVCHFCGHREKVPEICPECGKEHFMFVGCGTQKAEDDLVSLFPDLRILRMDTDTTAAKDSHEEILTRFRNREADVLLGTQMVTKGHDFPRVATVGVLNADGSLSVDDYRAAERTFSMLTQVIGRAGRADVPGIAVIQTYNPNNEVLLMAAKQDYKAFYEGEIRLRKAMNLPPFCHIAVITLSSPDETVLDAAAAHMRARIVEEAGGAYSDIGIIVYGPFEAPVYRVQNQCRLRFVIKCRMTKRTRGFLSGLICEFSRSPRNKEHGKRLTVSVDLDPSTV